MSRRFVLLAVAASAAFAAAPRARAWTDASVTSVAADVTVPREGRATVALTIHVRVRGGWLEQLELVGLDPGLELLSEPSPIAVDADGVTHVPTARVEPDGRVLFAFVREDAPHRGDVSLSLAYRARLAPELDPERETVRIRWTLPPWEAGLDGASLVLHVPGRATLPDEIACPSCDVSSTYADGVTSVTLHRTHLPRATPWDVALDVPRDVLALPPIVRPPPLVARVPAASPAWPTVLALAVVLAVLGFAKRMLFRRALSRRGVVVAPWSVPSALALGALAVTTTLAAFRLADLGPLGAAAGLAVLVALALRGTPAGSGWPRAGAFRSATRAELTAAGRARHDGWLSAASLLDATTPLGALVLVGLGAAAYVLAPRAAPQMVPLVRALPVLAAPLFVTSTRFHLPPTAADRLRALARIASRLRVPDGVALDLVVHEDGQGVAQETRLRLALAEPIDGLGRLDVAISVARGAGGFALEPVCLATVSAAGRLSQAIADAGLDGDAMTAPGGRRVAHVLPLASLPGLLAALGLRQDEKRPLASPERMSSRRARGARLDAIVAE